MLLQARGYYTFVGQKNETTPAGETGPWLLEYLGTPTKKDCELVLREYRCRHSEIT